MVIFVFALLMGFLPAAFKTTGMSAQDALAVETIEANTLIVYSSQGSDTTFIGYTSLEDAPDPPQWNVSENNYVEVWLEGDVATIVNSLELRHVRWVFAWWAIDDWLNWYYKDGTVASGSFTWWPSGRVMYYLPKESLIQAWDPKTHSSAFTAKCPHITVSIVFQYNETTYPDIGEAFIAGELSYAISYEWNPENTGFAILSVITRLFSFQGVGLGIPGAFGTLIDAIISMFFYIAVVFIAYKIFAGLIPWVSGGSGD